MSFSKITRKHVKYAKCIKQMEGAPISEIQKSLNISRQSILQVAEQNRLQVISDNNNPLIKISGKHRWVAVNCTTEDVVAPPVVEQKKETYSFKKRVTLFRDDKGNMYREIDDLSKMGS